MENCYKAYLEAEPNSTNKSKIRNTISDLEVQTKASMDNLFEKNLKIFDHVPLENDYKWYSGKHNDANSIVRYLSSVGKIKLANEVLVLSIEYAKKVGGQVLSVTLSSTFSFSSTIQQALKSGNEYSPDMIAIVARWLWLKGDVTGLKSLADWLKDKNENYYPAMVEVASGLLGLGYEEDAIAFARKLPELWELPEARQWPAARYAIRILYENPDTGFLNCYDRDIGRSTLWRMLKTRHLALKGKPEKIYSGTSTAMYQRRAHGKLITNDMNCTRNSYILLHTSFLYLLHITS